jgi:L-aspartate oxidase
MSQPADLPALPRRLAVAGPGWMETTDVVVVGSWVAGLTRSSPILDIAMDLRTRV